MNAMSHHTPVLYSSFASNLLLRIYAFSLSVLFFSYISFTKPLPDSASAAAAATSFFLLDHLVALISLLFCLFLLSRALALASCTHIIIINKNAKA